MKPSSTPFTLRSDADLLATFPKRDQKSVVAPKDAPYPLPVQHYYAWSEPSGVYTYLVYKRADWETPLGIVFQRNGSGTQSSPAGMCEWCHTSGPSNEIGLMTTQISSHVIGGTWLCLNLDCVHKIAEQSNLNRKNVDKLTQKLCAKIGEFYQRVRITEDES